MEKFVQIYVDLSARELLQMLLLSRDKYYLNNLRENSRKGNVENGSDLAF